MFKRINEPNKGDRIRARWAADLAKQVNRNSRALYSLSQFSAMDANNGHNLVQDSGGGGGGGLDYGTTWTFNKTNLTQVNQTITDSGGATHVRETATQITATGNLNGNSVTLIINIPT